MGKEHRFRRFFYSGSDRGLIVPIDHGLTVGALPGIQSVRAVREWIDHSAIRGVICHKGMAERLLRENLLQSQGLMIHLNGMSTLAPNANDKIRLTSVEAALRLGADAVSYQVNFDGNNDAANLSTMGEIADEAARFGLPVLAMVYDKVAASEEKSTERVRHLIRIAIEMGCDAIKIGAPKALHRLPEMLADVSEDIAVFLAGGELSSVDDLASLTRAGLRAGARGLCVGRNVFQRPDARETLTELQRMLLPSIRRVSEVEVAHAAH